MGSWHSTNNVALKRSNVKLQAQQVTQFNGSALKWHAWKKKTRAAIGTAGLLNVFDDEIYAARNPVDNETIFHILQVATSDGNAAHLVDKHEDEKDGKAAYDELVKWYEGDELTTETAEDVRAKIDKISLSTRTTASEYINDFLQFTKHLEELGESYTVSKTINIFLTQITDPDYASTVELCIENKLNIEECIERIRAKERRLGREQSSKRKGIISVRRGQIESKNDTDQNHEIDLEKYKTDKGFYSIPNEIWNKLSKDDQTSIKKINGKHRRKRERSDAEPPSQPNVITPRRTGGTDGKLNKKLKTVRIAEDDNEDMNENGTEEEDHEANTITNRRDVLRFRIKS
jgi:hypothetical protein